MLVLVAPSHTTMEVLGSISILNLYQMETSVLLTHATMEVPARIEPVDLHVLVEVDIMALGVNTGIIPVNVWLNKVLMTSAYVKELYNTDEKTIISFLHGWTACTCM